MDLNDFGIALAVWQREEIETPIYQTVMHNFIEDVSIYWSQICTTGVPCQNGLAKATGIFLTLRYLHVIASQTLASCQTTQGNVTLLDTYLLSHMHRGITLEMGRIIARIARNFTIDSRK